MKCCDPPPSLTATPAICDHSNPSRLCAPVPGAWFGINRGVNLGLLAISLILANPSSQILDHRDRANASTRLVTTRSHWDGASTALLVIGRTTKRDSAADAENRSGFHTPHLPGRSYHGHVGL